MDLQCHTVFVAHERIVIVRCDAADAGAAVVDEVRASDCQDCRNLGGHCAGVDCDTAAALARDCMDDQQQHGQQCVADSYEKHGNESRWWSRVFN